jgi:hypothetical protein
LYTKQYCYLLILCSRIILTESMHRIILTVFNNIEQSILDTTCTFRVYGSTTNIAVLSSYTASVDYIEPKTKVETKDCKCFFSGVNFPRCLNLDNGRLIISNNKHRITDLSHRGRHRNQLIKIKQLF